MLTEHIPLPNCASRHLCMEQRQPKKDRPGWVIVAYVWPEINLARPDDTVAFQLVTIASFETLAEANPIFYELRDRLRVLEAMTC